MSLTKAFRSTYVLRPYLSRPLLPLFQTRSSTSSTATGPSEKVGKVHVDQTKEGNDPDAPNTEHHKKTSAYAEMDDSGLHPAKNMNPDSKDLNPEKTPDRGTGIKTEGDSGKPGEANSQDRDVHTETREQPGENMTWGGKK